MEPNGVKVQLFRAWRVGIWDFAKEPLMCFRLPNLD